MQGSAAADGAASGPLQPGDSPGRAAADTATAAEGAVGRECWLGNSTGCCSCAAALNLHLRLVVFDW